MNRTIKDATVKRYHYKSHNQLVRHLDDFVAAYNFGRRYPATLECDEKLAASSRACRI